MEPQPTAGQPAAGRFETGQRAEAGQTMPSPSYTPNEDEDIAWLHKQIMSNVEVAFPCLFKGFPNTIEYKICIAAHPDKRYQASVFWGNPGQLKQKAFLQGSVAATMHLALESLCLASSELISVLQGKGLLVKASLQVGRTYLAKSGGFFDSNPEFWPM